MIIALEGPLIVQPEYWTVVFNREAATWWASFLAFGRYKHVRAYAYVPFLHVWVFVDPHLRGTDIVLAADGAPAQRLMREWIGNADLVRVRRRTLPRRSLPVFGFCVPAIRRLLGVPGCALRADGLMRDCLRHGGTPFETRDAGAEIPEPGGRPGFCAADAAARTAEH